MLSVCGYEADVAEDGPAAIRIIMLTGSAPKLAAGRAQSGLTLLYKPIALGDLKAAVDAACRQ
jgi:hypothetical protein